jgi:hypothetical protein
VPPSELLTLHAARVAEADHQRPGGDQDGENGDGQGRLVGVIGALPRARTASGLSTDWYSGSSGLGVSVTPSRKTTGAAAASLAHQRQRREATAATR